MFFVNNLIDRYINKKKRNDVIIFSELKSSDIISYIKKTNLILPFVVSFYIFFYLIGIRLPMWNMIKKFIDNVIILMQNDNCE